MKYFDYAATCPMDPEASKVYVKAASDYFGNASSLHDIGGKSSVLLEQCREELARLLGIEPAGLYFTSGGSESNFLAIEALLSDTPKKGKHIIASIGEHSSIHGTLARLEKAGYETTYLPFMPTSGVISLEDFRAAIREETVLAVIQHANSELGTIQPIKSIAEICKANNIYLHSDFVQSFGKLPLRSAELVSSFSFSAHKFYGPKGIGGVYIDPSITWKPFFPGSTHEKGLRPGTSNVPAIAAMTAAAQLAFSALEKDNINYKQLRQLLIGELEPIKAWMSIHEASEKSQLPGILGLRIAGIEGQYVMLELNRKGFAVSTGSACHVGLHSPSKAMQALGISGKEAKEFLRISLGRFTEKKDIIQLAQEIVLIVLAMKKIS
ncbi:IscS subfamily cysteine desulfurase [Mesobacillus harenae]|uniref:IscS subfamily cysteine desulfurase n=1 Tax=Mesobacillus harenae TaxID=2213203 RepID=UPI001581306F|nr:IscS subfamily cysteine desulfurase [Mesobacillus harenae]